MHCRSQERPGAVVLPPAPNGHDIEFRDVGFGYREGQPILDGALCSPAVSELLGNLHHVVAASIRVVHGTAESTQHHGNSESCAAQQLRNAMGSYSPGCPARLPSSSTQLPFLACRCVLHHPGRHLVRLRWNEWQRQVDAAEVCPRECHCGPVVKSVQHTATILLRSLGPMPMWGRCAQAPAARPCHAGVTPSFSTLSVQTAVPVLRCQRRRRPGRQP